MGAIAFTAPELALTEKEAAALATAIGAVADHYPVAIAPKTMAWCNLVGAAGMIYGPRIYMIRERVRQEAQQKKDDGMTTVYNKGFAPL